MCPFDVSDQRAHRQCNFVHSHLRTSYWNNFCFVTGVQADKRCRLMKIQRCIKRLNLLRKRYPLGLIKEQSYYFADFVTIYWELG
jgi:hypothetical protein